MQDPGFDDRLGGKLLQRMLLGQMAKSEYI